LSAVGRPINLSLELKDTKKKSSSSDVYMGCILIQCTLSSKSSLDYASQVAPLMNYEWHFADDGTMLCLP